MGNIYKIDITIESLETDNQFKVSWENKASYYREHFEDEKLGASILEYLQLEKEDMWQHSREHRLELGRRLFNFLDGPNRLLELALDKADKHSETLLLNLRKLDACENWPFELLAKDNTFLLLQGHHLVRRLSDRGEKKRYTPEARRLKMLLMCCAPLDYKPQLDFHYEEEKILRETDRLAIDIDVEDSGTLAGLKKMLAQNEYDVIHLSGHAGIDENNEPFFVTENEIGNYRLVSPKELWDEALMDNPPRLLFLSGCRTAQVLGKLAAGSFAHRTVKTNRISTVLGWSHRVDDVSATYAEAVFYQYLSLGKSILEALQLTRYKLENPLDIEYNKFQKNSACIWPQLRLFCDGTELNALVAKSQGKQPERELDPILRDKELPDVKEGFVGRRRQLQQGVKVIKDPGDHIGVLILGPAGLGKSSLAAKICHHCAGYHTIPIKGKLDAISLTEALKEAFIWRSDQKGEGISRLDMRDKLGKLCRQSFRNKKYLLLLDDFHENLQGWERGIPGRLLPEAANLLAILLQYLPSSGKMSSLIITSRFGFSLQENGRDLVKKRLKTITVTSFQEPEQRKMAHKLAQGFEKPYYPLLQLTAMGYGNPGLIKEIAGLVKDKKTLEIQQLQIDAAEIRKEFIRQYRLKELLANINEELSGFLRRLSIFRRPVPWEGILQLAKDAGLGEWKALLVRGIKLGLIEHFQTHGTYWVTPLLREELLPYAEKARPYHESACCYYQSLVEQKEYIEPKALEELIYHALGCGQEKNVPQYGAILVKYLRDEELQLYEARDKGIWIISELEKKNVLSTEYALSLLNETAVTMKRLNEFNEAVKYFKKAYDIHLESKGEMHETTALALNNLGTVWSALGNYRKAGVCFRRLLRIIRKTCGRDSIEAVTVLNNLGTAISGEGKHGEAVEIFKKALKIIKAKPGTECKEFAGTLNNLGEAWERQEEYKKAEVCYRKAYDIVRRLQTEPHPSIATCLNNLGSLQAAKGQYDKAIGYYRKALRMFTLCYGPFHLDVASMLSNLGDVYSHQGKKNAAQKNYPKALGIFRDLAPGHFQIQELEKKLKNLVSCHT